MCGACRKLYGTVAGGFILPCVSEYETCKYFTWRLILEKEKRHRHRRLVVEEEEDAFLMSEE
jgi:hypothetical protein